MKNKESLEDYGEVETRIYPIENDKVVVTFFFNSFVITSTEMDKEKLEKLAEKDNQEKQTKSQKVGDKLEKFGEEMGKDVGSALSKI